jgi:hypothetical protein
MTGLELGLNQLGTRTIQEVCQPSINSNTYKDLL